MQGKGLNFLNLFLAGLLALIVGYIALAVGSMTLAPALLVIGYCLLLPLALFRLGHSARDGDSSQTAGE